MLAIWGGSFLEPNPWQYFFGAGIGTNIGASVVWGFLAGFIGYFVARKLKAAWGRLHTKLDIQHISLHERLDAHWAIHATHAEKLDRLIAAAETQKPQPTTRIGKAPSE